MPERQLGKHSSCNVRVAWVSPLHGSRPAWLRLVQMVCIGVAQRSKKKPFSVAMACTAGDLGLRHRACAMRWASIKGSTQCDVCKGTITNVPVVPDASAAAAAESQRERNEAAERALDAVRIGWLVAVICMLFFNFGFGRSLVSGILSGVAYLATSRAVNLASRRSAAAVPAQGLPPGGLAF